MRLHCPKCAGEIPAADVNVRSLVAKCSHCDNVFGFENVSAHAVAEHISQLASVKRKVVNDTLYLSWDWSTPWAIPALIGAVFSLWFFSDLGFDLWFFTMAIICLGVSYWSVTAWVNSTTVIVNPTSVRVTHGPLPWRNPAPVASTTISQLYSGTYPNPMRQYHFNSHYFVVNMIQYGGGQGRLVEGLKSAEHAIYLEQQIEEFLGITDRSVRGELSRGL